jgi:hypothetical protein
MAAATLRTEERIGLVVALAAHAGLVAWLALWRPAPEPLPLPEKVSVTLSDEVSPVATAPDPSNEPAPDAGPEAGEAPPPPAPLIQPSPQPTFAPKPLPQPVARPVPPPRPVARPVPPRRDQIADLLDRRPTPRTSPPRTAPPRTVPLRTTPPKPGTGSGASRFADAFSKGVPGASGAGSPPVQAGPAELSSIRSSINAKVRVPWNSCSVTGLDVNKLRVSVTFALDKQGRIASVNEPQVSGITEANRAQAGRFGECAVKAIRTAAPYSNLPAQFYDSWKTYKLNFRKE